MTLQRGSRLGPYEIIRPLGAGGMGEVFEAKDTRLDRRVAVKVLPPHLSSDPHLRQRLEREAKAISALSHPHICTLFDIGREEKTDFLVLEYLEGESLAERLRKGALPLDELLTVAVQITDALDKAHRAGIVHRDLKPGNVMLTKSGAKLLDFGLAKADTPATEATNDLTSSPTMSQPLTAVGTIMGTFQYMAPEQLEGSEADVRSDLFALGATLHEMATGQAAFSGATQASLIGSILHERPPMVSSVVVDVPPALDRVIEVCLAKDPDQRWQTAHDVLLQLRWIAEGGSVVGAAPVAAPKRHGREKLAWITCGLLALALAGLGLSGLGTTEAPPQTLRFEIQAPKELRTMGSPRLSPDGTTLIFAGTGRDGVPQIWKRPLDALEAVPIAGTERAGRPFWSPDSQSIAFFAEGKLRRIPAAGGQVRTVCDAPSGSDGTWGTSGQIVFDGAADDPLLSVAASGGVARPVIEDPGEGAPFVGWPEFLPDGEHFLFLRKGPEESEASWLMVSDLEGNTTPVVEASTRVQYAAPGYLIYVHDDTLVAHRFDLKSHQVEGDPVPLVEDVGATGVGLAHFSASSHGTLVLRGRLANQPKLVQLDNSGREIAHLGESKRYISPQLSPQGDHLAASVVEVGVSTSSDLWTLNLARGIWSRLTFEDGNVGSPVWSSDSRTIYYTSQLEGQATLFRRPATGTGEAETLLTLQGTRAAPHSLSPDGRSLALSFNREGEGWGLWILPFDESGAPGEPYPFLDLPETEIRPSFSPDGRYIAYETITDDGTSQIMVAEFPGPGGRWQATTQGGAEPMWSKQGRELLYLDGQTTLQRMAVEFRDGQPIFSAPESFGGPVLHPDQDRNRFTVTPDGDKVVLLAGEATPAPTTVVVGWSHGLSE